MSTTTTTVLATASTTATAATAVARSLLHRVMTRVSAITTRHPTATTFLKAQTGAALAMLLILTIGARFAAMRGTKRRPFPVVADKLLRLSFLLSVVAPSVACLPRVRLPLAILSALYIPSYLDGSEKDGSRHAPRTSLAVRAVARQLRLSLIRTVPLNPQQQYIFALHPHAILPLGGVTNLTSDITGFSDLFPGVKIRALAASFCFYLPILRDFYLRHSICDAAKYCARNLIKKGNSLLLVPGGATEALYSQPNNHTLYLRRRTGFIRLALETGAHIVPCYSFGETDTYHQLTPDSSRVANGVKRAFQYLSGLSLPIVTHIVPHAARVTTVVGAPLVVPQIDEPTAEQVDHYLALYIEHVTQLFHTHRATYAPQSDPNITVM